MKNITTLAVDLDFHCNNWQANPLVTKTQRRLWPGNKLPHAALGTDDPHCLRLLKEDGHDGKPVGSCNSANAKRFFCTGNHVFPPERDLIRFGLFCHLGFFHTLHLVVKNQWEAFVVNTKKLSCNRQLDYRRSLSKFEDGELARLLDRFQLGLEGRCSIQQIYQLFAAHGMVAGEPGNDQQRFAALIDQMILSRVHYCGTAGPELQSFVERQELEMNLLSNVGHEEEYQFWLKKCTWLTIQSELEEELLLREDVRLKNFNVTMEWMALFGKIYVELMEAQMLCYQLERRISIKQKNPSLSEAEIDKQVKESIEQELDGIEKLKKDALQAATLGLQVPDDEPLSDDELERYRDQAKKIIREIWRLTHPDTLPDAFTERQQERLADYLEQVMQIKNIEAHYDVRAISVLKDILNGVKKIYETMGIDLEPESIIQGDTLAEQIAWLELEIEKIEGQLSEIRAEIQAMTMDLDIREKTASMAGEEVSAATMLELEQRKKEFKERILVLQSEYRRLLKDGETQ